MRQVRIRSFVSVSSPSSLVVGAYAQRGRCIRYYSDPVQSDSYIFDEAAEETLHELQERLEVLEDANIPDFDLEYSSGVLTVTFGDKGTYVLNKQSPNRQIWFSSPLSGPKRYDMSVNSRHAQWLDTRDKHRLQDRLYKEIKQLCGIDLGVTKENGEIK